MLRTIVLGAGALALGLGTLVGTGGIASATRVPVLLSGPVTCTATGSLKFSPALANGSAVATTVTLRVKFTGCSGAGTTSGGLTLTAGHLKATSAPFDTTCGAVLGAATLPTLTGPVTWRSTGGKAVASTMTVTGGVLYDDATADTITAYLPTSIGSGSYAGQSVTFRGLTSNASAYKQSQSCGAHGLGSVKFGIPGGTTTGAVSLGA